MPNQFTKAEEEGRDKPEGSNQFTTGKRTKHDEETKDKMRAAKAAAKLESILDDPEASKGDVIAAGKELMRYGKITADRKTEADGDALENRPEEELIAMVRALITARPALIAALNLMPKPVQVGSKEGESLLSSNG